MAFKDIFLVILGAVSLVYLVTLAFKPGIFQFILKGCLMPLVLCIYLFGVGVNGIDWPIIMALIFAWIGDVLLIRITNILWFKLGLASFLIGHIFYIIAMHGTTLEYNIPVLAVSIIIAVCFCIVAYKVVRPGKQMRIPVIAYEIIIMTMAVSAAQFFLSHESISGILVFAGSISFVVSDTLLALRTFRKVRIYFGVMVTYIAAQFLIILGFIRL
jgi:uncharacterized membrane protein YhhN